MLTAAELLDLGGIALAAGWRPPTVDLLDGLTEWMGHLADMAVRRHAEVAATAGELLAAGQALAARERGGPRAG